VRAFREEHRAGLEEAARRLRYRFLFERASAADARAVVTAHTADDRVETLVMHLLRGAGLRGLRGMVPETVLPEFDRVLPLVRPLLGTWRSQVEAYQAETGFSYVEDETNQDTTFFRNRVRHEILPFLAGYNPELKANLLRTAQALAADEAVLEQAAGSAWKSAIRDRSEEWIAWDAPAISGQPDSVLVRIMRNGIGALRPGADELDFKAARRAIRLIRSPATTGSCDLSGGFRLLREYDRFWLTRDRIELPAEAWPQIGANEVLVDAMPAQVRLLGDWVLALGAYSGERENGYSAIVDGDALRHPLTVRGRRTGERFEPLGLQGRSKRISVAMIDCKIPKRLRDGWPLLVSDGQIVWLPGHRIGERFAAGPGTRRPVMLRLFRD
jgi:tRNA(Ile)-lysidine synthase